MRQIKITHIYHSCYTVETPSHFIVFDYFQGQLTLPANKQVVFVASHGHADHYTSNIMKLPDFDDYIYILSTDIRDLDKKDNVISLKKEGEFDLETLKRLYSAPNVYFFDPDQMASIGQMAIQTFGSTDLGFSIRIEVDGLSYFHAGDLTWWDWDTMTPEERQKEHDDYMAQIEKIKRYAVDVAFIPVDPRLGDAYYKGGEIFIDYCKPQIFFPMHFRDNYAITQKFKKFMGKTPTQIRTISLPGESVTIDVEVV